MKQYAITAAFVDSVPDNLENGVLYISEKYKMAIHLCCCGCGEEVVTPLHSAGWHLHKEGAGVSLSPSIGNWKYKCQSHYWIYDNQVWWAGSLSSRQIARVKARDKADRVAYIQEINRMNGLTPSKKMQILENLKSWYRKMLSGL